MEEVEDDATLEVVDDDTTELDATELDMTEVDDDAALDVDDIGAEVYTVNAHGPPQLDVASPEHGVEQELTGNVVPATAVLRVFPHQHL